MPPIDSDWYDADPPPPPRLSRWWLLLPLGAALAAGWLASGVLAQAPDMTEQLRPNITARHWLRPAACQPFLEIAATNPCDYNNGAYHTARGLEVATARGTVVLDWTEGGGCNARGEGPGDWLRVVALPDEATAIPDAIEIFEKGPEADRVGIVRVYAPFCGM